MAVVRTNGLDISYQRVGAGPPLVLVHGAADNSRIWQPQLAALNNEFTVRGTRREPAAPPICLPHSALPTTQIASPT